MKIALRPLPVLYACQGCPQFGQRARDYAQALERQGLGQLVWLGDSRPSARPTERFPIFALDGCEKGCARAWLEARGITAERHLVVAA